MANQPMRGADEDEEEEDGRTKDSERRESLPDNAHFEYNGLRCETEARKEKKKKRKENRADYINMHTVSRPCILKRISHLS